MTSAILALALAGMIATADIAPQYEYIGECRITEYCPVCNDGAGHESASGVYLEYGHCACSWLPYGTVIEIEGEPFTVVDTCGTDAIDIFNDDMSGVCRCDLNEYRRVAIRRF